MQPVSARIDQDQVFKALAAPQRREILKILGARTPAQDKTCCSPEELCACRLVEDLGLAPSTVSHHMAILEKAGLVSARREGLWAYYSLEREALSRAAELLNSY